MDILSNYSDQGIDLSLLKHKLNLTPTQRLEDFMTFMSFIDDLRKAKIMNKYDPIQKDSGNILR